MRELGTSINGTQRDVYADQVGALTNDFFVALTEMTYERQPAGISAYNPRSRETGEVANAANRADLLFGSNSIRCANAEAYVDDIRQEFVHDFVAAWTKVMNADRFDLGGQLVVSSSGCRMRAPGLHGGASSSQCCGSFSSPHCSLGCAYGRPQRVQGLRR